MPKLNVLPAGVSSVMIFMLSAVAAPAQAAPDVPVVSEATGGRLKALKGQVFDKGCGVSVDYEAQVIDLNGDGQPEVLTRHLGACYGMAGVNMDLFVKDKNGRWKSQFGFPGEPVVLKSRHLGYPDIEVGGPGNCFPVWRWNGTGYALHKKCGR